MHHQYHCGCCNKVVASTDKECHYCGSHHIKSPYGFWIFCILSCLCVVIILAIAHIYIKNHQEVPTSPSFLDALQKKS